MDGRFELLQGEPFDGQLLDQVSGPMYTPRLARLELRNEGFTIDYAPGRKRGATHNAVAWRDDDGVVHRTVIGDHRALVVDDHRIYTSPNKGFAPVLRWQPQGGGAAVLGAVHLPSYPMHELRQSREWTLPDGRAVWLMLQVEDDLLAADAPARFRLPRDARLVLRLGDARHELAPGQSWAIAGGALHYEGLRTWMGYRVSHDPTLPWLLAASLVAALALAWHYAARAQPAAARDAAAPQRAQVRHA
jgi:cytochrome c biogenesis protein